MQGPRQLTVPHGHHHLDHTGHTRRGLRMTDVRLHRPQPQRTPLRTVLAICRQQRLRLDRVAQRRSRAVRLHHIHVTGSETRVRQRLPDDPPLGGTVRRGQAVRRPVLVHRRAADHREHGVAVGQRVGQALDEQQAHAFGRAEPVRVRREGLAPAVRREAALPAELQEGARGGHHRNPAGQRQ